MPTVELRDIVTDEDRAAALQIRCGPARRVSCGQEEGTPRPFYERYGFVAIDRVVEDELVLWLDLTRAELARP